MKHISKVVGEVMKNLHEKYPEGTEPPQDTCVVVLPCLRCNNMTMAEIPRPKKVCEAKVRVVCKGCMDTPTEPKEEGHVAEVIPLFGDK